MDLNEPELSGSGEALNQSDVDALLASVMEETGKTVAKEVQAYNFKAASFLSAGKLRRVRIKHEEFATNLSAAASQFLRAEFSVRLTNLETVTHKALVETLSGPTYLMLLRLDPLPGVGLLEISPRLGLSIVGRLLGGRGRSIKDERDFTEIELNLMRTFLDILFNEYMAAWQMKEQEVKIALIEHETSARFLKLASDNSDVFFVTLEARTNDCTGVIRLAFLHTTLEPLIKKMTEQIPVDAPPVNLAATVTAKIPESKFDIPIPIHARWDGLQISLDELVNLRPDDVILLDPMIMQRTKVFLGPTGHFMGQVVRKGDRMAVRITAKVKS